MDVREFIAEMREAIEEAKTNGATEIKCDNIIDYLNEIEKSTDNGLTVLEMEEYRAKLLHWIEQNKFHYESQLEVFRSVIVSGQSAIRSGLLLNGGAAVAMLAFIGHLASVKPASVAPFIGSLSLFSFGVLAMAVTSGSTYLSQWFYAKDGGERGKNHWTGFGFNLACIALGIVSYVLFVVGALQARDAFSSFGV